MNTKWEYMVIIAYAELEKNFIQELNEAGKQGWKVVPIQIGKGKVLMEREIP